MIGYRITEKGANLLNSYLSGAEFIWIPGVNYDRLNQMALTLNKVLFGSEDGWFSIDPECTDKDDLLALKALEMDGCIERSKIPNLERCLKYEAMRERHPERFYPWDPWEEEKI